MTGAEREHLRAIAANPLVAGFAPPWPEVEGWRCYVERRITPIPRRIGRAVLFGLDGHEAVFRRYTFELGAAPREEDVPVEPADVARLLDRLSRLGLWELNDFRPYAPVIDGGAHIVRAIGPKNTGSFLERPVVDACLACPEYAVSRDIRRIGREFNRLLNVNHSSSTALDRLLAKLGVR